MGNAYEVYDKNAPKNKEAERYMKEQYEKLGIPWRPKKARIPVRDKRAPGPNEDTA